MQTILPRSASPLQKAIDSALGKALARLDLEQVFDHWHPFKVPERLLIYLAWSLNIDHWDSNYPEAYKRELVAATIIQHHRRGTPDSLRRYLNIFGITDYQLIEGWEGSNVPPAVNIEINQPVSNLTASLVFDQINRYLPARSYVTSIDFSGATHSYDGTINYDNEFNYGVVENG